MFFSFTYFFTQSIRLYQLSSIQIFAVFGVAVRPEIIPLEPDLGNASEGKTTPLTGSYDR
jgi:hypothetical protein